MFFYNGEYGCGFKELPSIPTLKVTNNYIYV